MQFGIFSTITMRHYLFITTKMRKELLDLAEKKKNIAFWQSSFFSYSSMKVRKFLVQLQQALGIPLIEVWRLAAAFSYALSLGWAG